MNDSNNSAILWGLVVIIVLVVAAYLIWGTAPSGSGQVATTTPSGSTQTLVTPAGLSIPYDPSVFALAAAPEAVMSQSYIPPCDEGYQYCFYLASSTYAGTNFESAGIRVNARADLTTQSACLTTEPTGYTNITPQEASGSGYAVSAFAPLGDAAAGHYATGALYRLYYGSTCYEFQTRIGQSDFANYPAGTIQEFTAADEAVVESELANFLNHISIASSGTQVTFPSVSLSEQP